MTSTTVAAEEFYAEIKVAQDIHLKGQCCKVTDTPLEHATENIFRTTWSDNEPSLFCQECTFLAIMEKGIHKNASDTWETPLPFCDECQAMPDNHARAMQYLQGLINTFPKKPKMKADYLGFMGKIIEKGLASPIQCDHTTPPHDHSWYLLHFTVYHNMKHTPFALCLTLVASLKEFVKKSALTWPWSHE